MPSLRDLILLAQENRKSGGSEFFVVYSEKAEIVLCRLDNERKELPDVRWPVLGASFKPEVTVVKSLHTIIGFLEEDGPVFRCDDPMRRQVGFVQYFGSSKTAKILRISLTSLKSYPKYIRDIFTNLRDSVEEPFRAELRFLQSESGVE